MIGYTLGSRAGREAPLAQQLAEPRAPRVAHPESPRPRPPPPSPPSGVRCDVSEPSLCLAMDVDALRLENEMMTRANTDTCRRKIKDTAQFLRHGFRRHFPRHEFAERSCPVRRPPRTTPQRQPRLAATASSLHRVAIIGHGHWLRWEHPTACIASFRRITWRLTGAVQRPLGERSGGQQWPGGRRRQQHHVHPRPAQRAAARAGASTRRSYARSLQLRDCVRRPAQRWRLSGERFPSPPGRREQCGTVRHWHCHASSH